MNIQQAVEDLNSLQAEDLKLIGIAPLSVRIFLIIVLCCIIIGAGYWLFILPKQEQLESAQRQEIALRTKFQQEQAKVANLEAYREQLTQMEKTFSVMLRQLPDKTDIESLLIDLSQTSVASGLEVEFFKPSPERHKEFYAEQPIKLRVTGKYHEFGHFVSGLAALPRIVTLHDIQIGKSKEVTDQLKMDLTAYTYRYLKEEN